MNTKLDLKPKSILSPSRSLDEGFESDPDRISTDSESVVANHSLLASFDLYQRTDRDGVTHTSITRHNQTGYNSNNNINNTSVDNDRSIKYLICLSPTKQIKKLSLPSANNKIVDNSTQPRRSKTQQAVINQRIPRSHCVDSIRTRDLELSRGDILSGEFVRVTVDPPRQQQRIMTSSNTFYAVYPAFKTQLSNYGLTVRSCNNQQIPIGWTQSIPRQTRRYGFIFR